MPLSKLKLKLDIFRGIIATQLFDMRGIGRRREERLLHVSGTRQFSHCNHRT
jgi:hypothetical protein